MFSSGFLAAAGVDVGVCDLLGAVDDGGAAVPGPPQVVRLFSSGDAPPSSRPVLATCSASCRLLSTLKIMSMEALLRVLAPLDVGEVLVADLRGRSLVSYCSRSAAQAGSRSIVHPRWQRSRGHSQMFRSFVKCRP